MSTFDKDGWKQMNNKESGNQNSFQNTVYDAANEYLVKNEGDYKKVLYHARQAVIAQVIKLTGGNIEHAAMELGITMEDLKRPRCENVN